jgi:hypothetical protein
MTGTVEIVRQAHDRVARLALLDTSARPDTPELTQRRQAQIALARSGRLAEVADQQLPLLIHPSRHGDAALRGLGLAPLAARRWCWSATATN